MRICKYLLYLSLSPSCVCVQGSFDGAKVWVNELLSVHSSDVLIALAGNKSDLEASRQVDTEVGLRLIYTLAIVLGSRVSIMNGGIALHKSL